MPCGWKGNRRSGVALVMHHRLQWFIHVRAQGDERPVYTPHAVWHTLPLLYLVLHKLCEGKDLEHGTHF